jgi:iron-sulfur cluster repair protein YtfE (RIC family)
MSTDAETPTAAWRRRAALAGDVDFTMMYVAHDAFNRDLTRLVAAAEGGRGLSEAASTTWRGFAKQLHNHHTAEDTALWPRLGAAVADPVEHRVLADMEREHAALDPRIEQVDAAIAAKDDQALADELRALAAGLSAHMVHEETEALPLLERRLGQGGWEAFTREVRERQGGIKGAADYLPWVLDGADEQVQAKVLQLLPAPARLLYRRSWLPRYRRSNRLR